MIQKLCVQAVCKKEVKQIYVAVQAIECFSYCSKDCQLSDWPLRK